ncbi:MAG: lysylphosphatidylglycerol synthase domain-containing protein [Pseudodesulfovibrio sp.]|uniref:lysylphosphatidylglycerol synthase domain-containing protein n=1 Tax=Pseudodesulfovibrio sp. TaxID=2035812 RepID=UPI003D0C3CD5
MPKNVIKAVKVICSWLLLLASFYYIYSAYQRNMAKLAEYSWTAGHLSLMALAAVCLGALYLVLGWAWSCMAADQSPKPVRRRLLGVYARTSIYKYLPGNVFHMVGRNVIGGRAGVRQSDLASATFFEVVLSVLNSFGVAVVLLLFSRSQLYPRSLVLIALVAYLLIVAAFFLIPKKARAPEGKRSLAGLFAMVVTPPPGVSTAIPLAISLFAGMACVAIFIWAQLITIPMGWAEIGACYVLGWLVGYVVPGAPGGIGVREAFLLFAMSPYAGEADILLFAFIMRLVATGADLFLFLFGTLLEKALPATSGAPLGPRKGDASP